MGNPAELLEPSRLGITCEGVADATHLKLREKPGLDGAYEVCIYGEPVGDVTLHVTLDGRHVSSALALKHHSCHPTRLPLSTVPQILVNTRSPLSTVPHPPLPNPPTPFNVGVLPLEGERARLSRGQVTNSPCHMNIAATMATAGRCYAFGPGLGSKGHIALGTTARFTIVACDVSGTRRRVGGDPFKVVISPRQSAHHLALRVKIHDGTNGAYTVSWTPPFSGGYLIHITLRGVCFRGAHSPAPCSRGAHNLNLQLSAATPLKTAFDRLSSE